MYGKVSSEQCIQQWCCEFIITISQAQDNGPTMVLNAPGSVINCIVMALQAHSSNVKVVEQGIQALLLLVEAGESSRSNASELNAYDLVRVLVTRYKSNPAIKEYGGQCLKALKPQTQKLRSSPKQKKLDDDTEKSLLQDIQKQTQIQKGMYAAQSESGKTYTSVTVDFLDQQTYLSLVLGRCWPIG